MTTITKELEFISPAFLTGGDQSQAELRAASIRGELRWWFRVLGGTPEEETAVFGGVHPEACASKVIVRVSNVKTTNPDFQMPANGTNRFYLAHYAKASANGVRIGAGAYFATGTTFKISLIERQPIAEESFNRLQMAFDCFARLGSLGLRGTRTFGAMKEKVELSRSEFATWVKSLPDNILVGLVKNETCTTIESVQDVLGEFLRSLRKENDLLSNEKTALGFSIGQERGRSALRLRPVKIGDNYLPVVIYCDDACSKPSQSDLVKRKTISL